MTIAVDIVLSVLLITLGYAYTCFYFNGVKWNNISFACLKPSKNKILYVVGAVSIVALLIGLFETVYNLSMIPQVKLLSLVLVMIPIAAVDLRVQKIPNNLILTAIAIRVIIYIAEFCISIPYAVTILKDNLLGAVIIGAFFLILLLVFKNSIGMGDIKLFAVMGLYQGVWGAINSVFFSLLVSFVLSIGLLVTKRKGRKDTISFGPCILIGTVIAISLAGM